MEIRYPIWQCNKEFCFFYEKPIGNFSKHQINPKFWEEGWMIDSNYNFFAVKKTIFIKIFIYFGSYPIKYEYEFLRTISLIEAKDFILSFFTKHPDSNWTEFNIKELTEKMEKLESFNEIYTLLE